MERNLKGFLWNLSENLTIQVLQFAIGIIMARILTPDDYGLIGILYVYIAVCTAIMNGGFSAALIQNTKRTEDDYCTAFYFNIIVSLFFTILLFLFSPLIAAFYNQSDLKGLTKVMALPMIINAFNLVQRTRFTIEMNFKILAKIGIMAALVQGLSGIWMAHHDYGAWAVAWSCVFGSLCNCVLCWTCSGWIPRKTFSTASFKRMFNYGSKLLLSSLLDTIWNNIYPLVIGKKFPPASLGYYTRAQHYATLPVATITDVISRVTFPILSEMQHDKAKLKASYNNMLRMVAFFIFPLMTMIAVLAQPLICLFLTTKWAACVIYLQILCFAMMFYPISALNLSLLKVTGRSDLFLKLEVWKKVLGVIIMVITIPLGIISICWGIFILSVASLLFNTYYTGKFLDMGIGSQIKLFLPALFSTSIMAISMISTNYCIDSYELQLLLGFLIGFATYGIVSKFIMPDIISTVTLTIKNKQKNY